MQLTLKDAKEELADSAGAYASGGLVHSINKAIRALAGMRGWQRLRKSVRFASAGPCFTLPQGCAGLVRACVNGRPTTVRGQDFRFIQSGPGDTPFRHRIPKGFTVVSNVVELGRSPVMVEPAHEFRVFAYKDDPDASAEIRVDGIDVTGRHVSVLLSGDHVYSWPAYDASGDQTGGTDPSEAEPSETVFREVTSVTLGGTTASNMTLYASDACRPEVFFPISQYDRRVKVPTFMRYELPDIRPGQPIEILAEVRIDPLPLVDDSDILPFDSTEPIGYMIRAEWAMRSGEATQAEKYWNAAAGWLMAQEVADDTKQTQFMINSVMSGSPGEVSMEAENI